MPGCYPEPLDLGLKKGHNKKTGIWGTGCIARCNGIATLPSTATLLSTGQK
jgi:hypothetical protein